MAIAGEVMLHAANIEAISSNSTLVNLAFPEADARGTGPCIRTTPNAMTLCVVFVDCLFSIVAITGNLLVISSILSFRRRLFTITNTFVLSLAAADLLVGLNVPFYVLFYLDLPALVCSRSACLIRYWFTNFTSGCSMLCLLGVAVDRYVAILHPLHYRSVVCRRHATRFICASWAYMAVVATLPLLGPGRSTVDARRPSECDLYYVYSAAYALAAVALHVLVGFVATTVLYTLMFREAYRHSHAFAVASTSDAANCSSNQDQHHQAHRQETRVAKTMCIVLGTYLLGFFPYLLTITLRYCTGIDLEDFRNLKRLAVCLYFAKSAANPFIYGWMNRDFRTAFKHLLFGEKRRRVDQSLGLVDWSKRKSADDSKQRQKL